MKSTKLPSPQRVFVDTSGWIAFLLKKETRHEQVANLIQQHILSKSKFITSDYVLDETYTRLITNQSLYVVDKMHELTEKLKAFGNLLVLFTDETIFHKSWTVFKKYADHHLSFTDATIVTYYQDLKLDLIVTLDQGFSQIGLHTTPQK